MLSRMKLDFVNREAELRELHTAAKRGGLLVVYGRRRVGKTRLLRHWLAARDDLYSQAIEAQRDLQIQQVFEDLRARLETQLVPKTWPELLEILALQERRWALCLDEFPYLTAVDPSLPSQLQKWLDHSLPPGCLLILAGSSTRMMHDLFLNRARRSTVARANFCTSRRWITRRSAGRANRTRATWNRSRSLPASAASRSIGSSSRPGRMWWRWRSRSTSISPPTWNKSRNGFCATRVSSA